MTQEEKQLLLKDLCARLPYGVKCNAVLKQVDGSLKSVFGTFKGYNGWATVGNNLVDIETVTPYLRPMSSMTEKEKEELFQLMGGGTDVKRIDFYISHHFDYRGLIEKGLALEAPEDMYHAVDLNVVDTVDDIMYDIDSDNVEVIYKSGKKTIHNIESLKLISLDERELGTEHDYLIEPNIHVVFYPEGHISTFYFDE